MSSAYLGFLRCLRCGRDYPESAAFTACPPCAADGQHVNAHPVYDAARLGSLAPDRTQPGVFAYRRLLPLDAATPVTSLGEGGTPLVPLARLGTTLGLDGVWLKDEARNPTWSYKDRLAAVGIAKAREAGADTVVVSSTGNHGAAVSAYAAAAGLRCVALTIESVPLTMKTLMQAYGATVVALRHPPDRWRLMREAIDAYGWVPMSGFLNPPAGSNPFAVDGYKTIAYEIVDTLGRAPDVVVTPVAYGDGAIGLRRGFEDLIALGVIDSTPRIIAAEVFGPYEQAFRTGTPGAPSAVPAGASAAFSIGTPVSSFQGFRAVDAAVTVGEDAEIVEAQLRLARLEGLYLEASSVLPIAALGRLRDRGEISAGDTVVCVGTSTGLKDIDTTAARLPAVPVIEPNLAALDSVLAASAAP